MASVELIINEAVSVPQGGVPAYRIDITIQNPVDISEHLFVIERNDTGSDEDQDQFMFVAAASDLVNVPVQTGDEQDGDLYRTDNIELWVDSLQVAEDFVDSVRRRIDALLISRQETETFQQTRTILVEA
jgi:hypothetical protein